MKKALVGMATAFVLFASSAHAILLTVGDANYVGKIDDGIPSSPALEVTYINDLIQLAPGDVPEPCGTEICDRIGSTLVGPLPAATATGAVKDETGGTTVDSSGFDYILGKYGNAGSLVWFIGSLVDEATLPATLDRLGLSHISLYNCVGECTPPTEVPEPGPLGLIGLALLAVALRRRMVASV